jgi:hypothetical protein
MFEKISAARPEVRAVSRRSDAASRSGASPGHQHLGAEGQSDCVEARLPARAGQVIERVGHFERVAGGAGERRVHVGDQRGGAQAGPLGHRDDALGQRPGLVEPGHEGAGALLDVHHQALEPGGQLLRQDRRGDQVEGFDRAGNIADRVEAPVGRGQLGGLADDRTADLTDDPAEGVEPRGGVVARDAGELVERPAGMAEAAAGDHRHEAAAGRHHRGERQAHRVADAAGGMLVENRARQVPGEHPAGFRHRPGQRHALGQREAAEEHRHGEGRRLPLPDRAVGEAADEGRDLLRIERQAVPLGPDGFLRQAHALKTPVLASGRRTGCSPRAGMFLRSPSRPP